MMYLHRILRIAHKKLQHKENSKEIHDEFAEAYNKALYMVPYSTRNKGILNLPFISFYRKSSVQRPTQIFDLGS